MPIQSSMVAIVVTFNISISLFLLGIAWKVWQFKKQLAKATEALGMAEYTTYNFLSQAPILIGGNQQQMKKLQQRNKALYLRTQYLQQIISLAFLARKVWNRYLRATNIAKPFLRVNKLSNG
ncbi:MAG: hypothetical protein AAF378_11520 [Cyanobacteria bacterium P01_A01_bin.84]